MRDNERMSIWELIGVLVVLSFIFWVGMFSVWYTLAHRAPECIFAKDTITCVEMKQLGGE